MSTQPAVAPQRPVPAPLEEPPIYRADLTLTKVTEDILAPVFAKPTRQWWTAFLIAAGCFAIGVAAVVYQLIVGMGIIGIQWPAMWGTYIANFVFWIGIGHAGTLISAILFLFRQRWRTAINRSAEAMTIFAVAVAGMFPLLHVGRTVIAYWLFPYPNQRHLWVNFRSPLIWDVFAVSTYATISILFWYQGMIPDLATVRDRIAKTGFWKKFYGVISLGWKGHAKDWHHYEVAYAMLAAIATPLVLSVHSNVSTDFATATAPGWHSTIFPPYFVAGAIFSGFAMVVTLLVIVRYVFRLEDYLTIDHMEMMNKIILVTSMMVGYSYFAELFTAWYTSNVYEQYRFYGVHFDPHFWLLFHGPNAAPAYLMWSCNVFIPALFWFRKIRRSIPVMFILTLFVSVGMWFERYTIIVDSQMRQYLPSSWGAYRPTRWDYAVLLGSFGMFFSLFLLFCRFVPVVAVAEVKQALRRQVGEPPAPQPAMEEVNA